MNEGIHLDLDTWIVPGQIRKANLCRTHVSRKTQNPGLRQQTQKRKEGYIIIIIIIEGLSLLQEGYIIVLICYPRVPRQQYRANPTRHTFRIWVAPQAIDDPGTLSFEGPLSYLVQYSCHTCTTDAVHGVPYVLVSYMLG